MGIPFGIAASAILSTGDYRDISAVLGAMSASHSLAGLERWPRMAECPCSQGWREGTPVFGVAYTEVCYPAYVKTSRCVTLRPGLGSRDRNGERRTENGER